MQLDMVTIFLSIAIGHFITAILVSAYWYQHFKDKTVTYLFIAKIAQASAWMFLALREGMTDPVTISISNTLLFIGAALEVATILSLHGRLTRKVKNVLQLLLLFNLIGYHVILVFFNTEPLRIAFTSAGTAAVIVITVIPMIVSKQASLLTRIMGWFYVLIVLSFVVRAVAAFFTDVSTSFYAQGSFQTPSLFILYLIMLTTNMGSFLLMKQNADKELMYLANHDELTNTLNRRAFHATVAKSLTEAAHKQSPLTLIFFDIDHFKTINDTHGHNMGDRVLQHVTDIVTPLLNRKGILSRYGGDEFAVLLTDCDEASSAVIAERIRQAVDGIHIPGLSIKHTVSVGVYTLIPNHHTQLDKLYSACDKALYDAKKNGRNLVCYA